MLIRLDIYQNGPAGYVYRTAFYIRLKTLIVIVTVFLDESESQNVKDCCRTKLTLLQAGKIRGQHEVEATHSHVVRWSIVGRIPHRFRFRDNVIITS
jgi:hypothetical protein